MRILFLDLDTLRPDHLGCYGYHRNTSPTLDKIAEEGVRYENYYCSDAPCLPSRAALMSGQFGIHTGVVNHGGTNADMRIEGESRHFQDRLAQSSLPGMLRTSLGLKTVCISPFATRHSSWTFYAGFNEIHDTGKCGMESGEDVTPTVLKWIEDNAENDNWYLHVNYWDAHTPYRAPEEFGNPFEDEPIPDWISEDILKEHNNMVGPHNSQEIAMFSDKEDSNYPRHPGAVRDIQGLRKIFDGYDCGIRYMDSEIEKLLKAFEAKGVLDELIIIVSADHAENIGELGLYAEHATADYANCRIPMIIRWPGACKGGSVDKELHYNLDLLPTLAEMAGVEKQEYWDGKSFASSIKGENEGNPRDYVVVSQCAHVCQRGVRFDDWMYIRTYHDGFHLFPKEMLFNIKEDPHEQNNIASENPEVVKDAVYKLMDWHDQMMSTMDCDTDPLQTVLKEGGPFHAKGHLKEYCKYLKKTGREYAIEDLKKKHPNEFL